MSGEALMSCLVEAAAPLGDDELKVMIFIARRLQHGAREYGALDISGDRRDWKRELGEECADALVYGAAMALRKP